MKSKYIFDKYVPNPYLIIIGLILWYVGIMLATWKVAIIFTLAIVFILESIVFGKKRIKK